jgi:heterogeneous nuclear rnp K-like protein 2
MSVDTVPAPAPADAGSPTPAAASTNAGDAASKGNGSSNAAAGSTSPNAGNSAAGQFTLRALVSSKEAGIIIGKAGKNVADLRDATGVKAGVSKVVQGVPERVLSVSGTLEGVTKVSWPSTSPLSMLD